MTLLLGIFFVSGETVTDGLFVINTDPVQGANKTGDSSYNVYAMVDDMSGVTQDLNNVVCVGLMCQYFNEEESVTPGGGGVAGGAGGDLLPEQRRIVDINSSLNQCIKEGGTPVNIKGGLFCKKNDLYYPIVATNNWDFGGMLIKGNPTLGWVIITLIVSGFVLFVIEEKYVVDRRDMRLLKRYKRRRLGGIAGEDDDELAAADDEEENPKNYY